MNTLHVPHVLTPGAVVARVNGEARIARADELTAKATLIGIAVIVIPAGSEIAQRGGEHWYLGTEKAVEAFRDLSAGRQRLRD